MDELEKNEHSQFLYQECSMILQNENMQCVMTAITRLILDLIEENEWDIEEAQDYFRIVWKTALLIKKREEKT